MSFNFSPKIVTNGLVTYYDAANSKSYISGSTTWSDMYNTPTNDLTLFSGATFSPINNGTMVYNGVNSRTSMSKNINVGDNFTVSVWMNAGLLGPIRRGLVGNSYPYILGQRNGWFFSTAGGSINDTFFFSIGADTAILQGNAGLLTTNTWYYLTVTVLNGGGALSAYINGVLTTNVSTALSSGTILYPSNQFHIGFRDLGPTQDPFTGNISMVKIYNRILTPQEILQNYNTTKSRYGKL